MKKLFAIVLSIMMLFSFAGCGGGNAARNPEGISPTAVNAMKQPHFDKGLRIGGTDTKVDGTKTLGYIDYNGAVDATESAWRITQWMSRQNLAYVCNTSIDGNVYTYENDCKKLVIDRDKGSIVLRCNAGFDYDYKPKEWESSWIHLLIEQEPVNYKYGASDSVTAYVDFSLDEITNYLTDEYDPNIHAAQLVWYFQLTHESERLWFGIPLYDNREDENGEVKGESVHFDKGTGIYVYSIDKYDYLGSEGAKAGNRYKCVIPLDSAIITAYNNAKNLGLFQNASVDDLVLRGMNFGWEIPGTFDAQMTLYDIGLYFDLKENA